MSGGMATPVGRLLFVTLQVAVVLLHSAATSTAAARNGVLFDSPYVRQLNLSSPDARMEMPAMVVFYAPWCIHSQELENSFVLTARGLQDVYSAGAIDADKYNAAQLLYPRIYNYPVVKFRVNGPEHNQLFLYTGEYTYWDLTTAAMCLYLREDNCLNVEPHPANSFHGHLAEIGFLRPEPAFFFVN